MENKIEKIMKKFEGKNVKVTLSGLIESKFYIKDLKYCIEEEILQIENDNDAYLDIDLDDIHSVYIQSGKKGFLLLVLNFESDLQIKLSINGDNIVTMLVENK